MTVLGSAFAGLYLAGTPLAAGESLLGGKVRLSAGAPLAGVPVRAHRAEQQRHCQRLYERSRQVLVPGVVRSDAGLLCGCDRAARFRAARRDIAILTSGETARVDFILRSRQPTLADATASEIVAALPGTDEQKHLVIQCDNCHSLQFALRTGRTKDEWIEIIRRMAGERAVSRETPGTRAFGQKKYVEPLAEYLASIRGPGSTPDPVPAAPAADRRCGHKACRHRIRRPARGHRDLTIIRGDRRFVWPHDILLDPKRPYAYYTDHFSFNLGRLDRRTGDVKEFPYSLLPGMGREEVVSSRRDSCARAIRAAVRMTSRSIPTAT